MTHTRVLAPGPQHLFPMSALSPPCPSSPCDYTMSPAGKVPESWEHTGISREVAAILGSAVRTRSPHSHPHTRTQETGGELWVSGH